MADEQGFTDDIAGLADGQFSRKETGGIVKSTISRIHTLLQNVGTDGRGFTQRSSPPSNPEVGDLYLTDGTNWDPNAAGSPELVVYDTTGAWSSVAIL